THSHASRRYPEGWKVPRNWQAGKPPTKKRPVDLHQSADCKIRKNYELASSIYTSGLLHFSQTLPSFAAETQQGCEQTSLAFCFLLYELPATILPFGLLHFSQTLPSFAAETQQGCEQVSFAFCFLSQQLPATICPFNFLSFFS